MILLVDDEPINLRLLDSMLRDEYEISVALNGKQALKRAVNLQPDLILLDVKMLEMDGYEVCRRLKLNEKTMNIPVIFVTSKADEEDEIKGLELGAVDYIAKPFRMAIIKARLHNHLELKRQRDLLSRLSTLDGLTGIANRRTFETALEREWRVAVRQNNELALIFTDIDHFKAYNDNYGHMKGDACLREVAQILARTPHRAVDLVARFGGEEFVCLLPGCGIGNAQDIAERMRNAVLAKAIPHAFSKTHNCVSLSFGVSCLAPGATKCMPSDLVIVADRMLYQAKEQGRNRVVSAYCGAEAEKRLTGNTAGLVEDAKDTLRKL